MIRKISKEPDWFSKINIEAGKKGLFDFSNGMDKKANEEIRLLNTEWIPLENVGMFIKVKDGEIMNAPINADGTIDDYNITTHGIEFENIDDDYAENILKSISEALGRDINIDNYYSTLYAEDASQTINNDDERISYYQNMLSQLENEKMMDENFDNQKFMQLGYLIRNEKFEDIYNPAIKEMKERIIQNLSL